MYCENSLEALFLDNIVSVQLLSVFLSHSQVQNITRTSHAATLLNLAKVDMSKHVNYLNSKGLHIHPGTEGQMQADHPIFDLMAGRDKLLQDAVSSITQQSSVECTQCGRMFHGEYCKYNLKKHLTIHAGIKPYSCSLCSRTFNQKSSMRRHISMVHNRHPDTLFPLPAADSSSGNPSSILLSPRSPASIHRFDLTTQTNAQTGGGCSEDTTIQENDQDRIHHEPEPSRIIDETDEGVASIEEPEHI